MAPSPVVPAVVNVTGMSVSLSWSAAGLVAGCQRIVFDLAQVTYTVRYWVEPELEDTAKVALPVHLFLDDVTSSLLALVGG